MLLDTENWSGWEPTEEKVQEREVLCSGECSWGPIAKRPHFKRTEGDGSLDRTEKELFVAEMRDRLARAQATFLVSYQGIDVEGINSVRMELRKFNTEFRVVKNRLLKRATQGTETACIQDQFVGTCALAIIYDDVMGPAKILVERDKKTEHLKLKVGQIAGKVISVEDIRRLADLPSREVLLAQVLAAMQAVPTSLVRALNGVVLKLLYVLKSLEQKKSGA